MPEPRARRPVVAASAAAAAAILALALAGCSADADPSPRPTSSPDASEAAPIFASDEEALAAAVAAYEAYAAASDAIMQETGRKPERLDEFVTPRYAPHLHEEFQAISEAGVRVDGPSTLDTVSLASHDETDGSASISIYMCRDVTGVRVLNKAGEDVTPKDREDRVPSQAFLVSSTDDARTLLVDKVTRWSGEDFC